MLKMLWKAGVPALFWGTPGVGKSAKLRALVENSGGVFCAIYPSRVDPVTVAGLPAIRDGRVTLAPWAWVERVNRAAEQNRPALIFFDEINGGDLLQLAAVQSAVAERLIGEVAIHPAVRIWAAANPVATATCGLELPPPILNRFVHIRWWETGPAGPAPEYPYILSKEEWLRWMRGEAASTETLGDDRELPPNVLQRAREMIAAAIKALGLPIAETPAGQRPFASPRSWEMAARLVAVCPHGPELQGLLLGAVGPVGAKAAQWIADIVIPSAEDLLYQGAAIPGNPDLALAAADVVAEYIDQAYERGQMTEALARASVIFLGRLLDAFPGAAAAMADRVWERLTRAYIELGLTMTPEEQQICHRFRRG